MRHDAQQPAPPALPAPAGRPAWFVSPDGRFVLYHGDCLELMPLFPAECVDLIFADPPYFLSNDGITCHAGRMVSVNKGRWDRSRGFAGNYAFTRDWLAACRRLLKPDGTIWVSGTSHIIHIVGACLEELGYKLLNDITWVKPNPPPNLSCRYFTHATETVLWAGRDRRTRHRFNYPLMKRLAGGKQMTSVWTIEPPRREEKVFGKHPTQKPLALLERILAAASDEDNVVLDPFSGSATTGIAAARMNRLFSGVELDSSFLNLAAVRFEAVPQADDPDRILELVRDHVGPPRSVAERAARLRLTDRHVHYYRHAAQLLGFLGKDNDSWKLTEAGKRLIELPDCATRELLARHIQSAGIVQAAQTEIRRRGKTLGVREVVARMLERCTALGPETCRRRAQTLLSWMVWAAENAAPDRGLGLFADVSPAPEEADNAPVAKKL